MTLTPHNNLKLLFISADKFPPFRVDVSVLFGKEIVGRGHVIDWILQSDKTCYRDYQAEWSGCRVWVGRTDNGTSTIRRLRNHLFGLWHDFKMFKVVKRDKYNLILIRDKFLSAVPAILVSRIFALKFVFWLSYPFPEASLFRVKEGTARYPFFYWVRGHLFRFLLYRILLPFSDHIFVQKEQMRSDIAKHRISLEKMTPVPMAVSIKDIPFFGHKIDTKRNKKEAIVVYIGTLGKVRKMDFLLRVFEKVLKKEMNVRLFLVGGSEDPSDEKFLKDEAKRLRIDHAVIVTGFLPQNEAWQYVKEADLCVSPIYPAPILNCGSPTKLIEYMAMGKAVVANDHPEQHLVISESKAGICVPYEETAFAEAIVYLLNNPDVARQMGVRGRKYVETKRNYEQTADLVETKLLELSKISQLLVRT